MKNIFRYLLIALAVVACTAELGAGGTNGTDGVDGVDGVSIGMFTEATSNAVQRVMYETYGGQFLNLYNYIWTSNNNYNSSLEKTQAYAKGYNGCSNQCVTGRDESDEFAVLPIRKF